MDFAKDLLAKYGWTKGQGLGKNNTGISTALKPKLKFDTAGIGHDPAKQFTTTWWENAYNLAADNICIHKSLDGDVKMSTTGTTIDMTNHNYTLKQLVETNKHMEYGTFIKTATLTKEGQEIKHANKPDAKNDPLVTTTFKALTDEELFHACGGRTAHKGARHGLNLTGKLARIERQEQELLKLPKYKKNKLEKIKSDIKYRKLSVSSIEESMDDIEKFKTKNNIHIESVRYLQADLNQQVELPLQVEVPEDLVKIKNKSKKRKLDVNDLYATEMQSIDELKKSKKSKNYKKLEKKIITADEEVKIVKPDKKIKKH